MLALECERKNLRKLPYTWLRCVRIVSVMKCAGDSVAYFFHDSAT